MRTLLAGIFVAAVALATSCLPDFDEFETITADGDGDSDGDGDGDADADGDADGDGDAGGDGDGDGDGDADADGDADGDADADEEPRECARPQLLLSVEDTSNTDQPGRVVRFELTGEPPFLRCDDLDGGGGLPSQPWAVAWIEGDHVAVGDSDTVYVLDPSRDVVVETFPIGGLDSRYRIRDMFQLDTPDGDPLLAVGVVLNDYMHIVTTYDLAALAAVDRWSSTDMTLLGSSVLSVTRSPLVPSHFLALNPIHSYAAVDVDPFEREVYDGDPYADMPSDTVLTTIYSFEEGDRNRTTWAAGDEVRYVYESTGGSSQVPGTHMSCSNIACDFVHAVPDPTSTWGAIALCDDESFGRTVVRMPRSGAVECDVIFEAASIDEHARISRLAIGLEH